MAGRMTSLLLAKAVSLKFALMYQDKSVYIHLSVECKNIRDNFPLVVLCKMETG
jgi:hypothetical protein